MRTRPWGALGLIALSLTAGPLGAWAGGPLGNSRIETFLRGVILEVNKEERTLLLREGEGRQSLVQYDGETLFLVRGPSAVAPELRPGLEVTVWGAAVLGERKDGRKDVCPISFLAGQVEVGEPVAMAAPDSR